MRSELLRATGHLVSALATALFKSTEISNYG